MSFRFSRLARSGPVHVAVAFIAMGGWAVLANGAHPMVDWENDKPTVVALREIAEGYITEEILTQRDKPVEDILAADLAAVTPMSPDDLLGSRPVSIGD